MADYNGNDIPDHLNLIRTDIPFNYAAPSDKMRTRNGKTSARERQRLTWNTGMMVLPVRSPVTDDDVVKLWTLLAQQGIREMLKNPLVTMDRYKRVHI